jgi:fructose-bisphosphate aldolase class II
MNKSFMKFSPIKILKDAQRSGYAIGQFNVSNLEQIRAVCEAAKELRAPIIIGTSEGERKFIGLKQIAAIVRAWQEETGLPIILNADHSKSFESAKEAVDAGYHSVHFDGSELPYKENLEITRQVVEYVKSKNPEAVVEGELGRIPGASAVHEKAIVLEESDFTDPDLAREFAEETGIDGLAVSFGNIHGVFGKDLEGAEKLSIGRLEAICDKVGAYPLAPSPAVSFRLRKPDFGKKEGVFLVLHGGSGISAAEIKESIKNGIAKININTELRVAYIDALRAALHRTGETTPYKIWPPIIEAVKEVVEEKIKLFGSENKI